MQYMSVFFWARMASMADGGLADLPVADDQLALSLADGSHGVHRLQAGVAGLMHALPGDDAGRLDFHAAGFGPSMGPLPSMGSPTAVTTRPRPRLRPPAPRRCGRSA
jgi:hypothetical protein